MYIYIYMSNDENCGIYDFIDELSLILVENIYPSSFGVCIFLFLNHNNKIEKDILFVESIFLGTGIYLTTIIYNNYNNYFKR
jgi:hypothetical protein